MAHATDIVAYVYVAEILCPEDTKEAMLATGLTAPAAQQMAVEPLLDQIAAYLQIDRQDEHTFDSHDFPKVVFLSDLFAEDETCSRCHRRLT